MSKRLNSYSYNQSSFILKSLPSVMLIIATLLTMVELPLPFAGRINPLFSIIAIFYLSLWQPRFLSIWVVFVAGIIFDCFQPTELGTYGLLFMLMRYLTCKMRNRTAFIAKPMQAWWRFALIAGIFFVIEWSFISILMENNMFSTTFLWRSILTIIIYPIIHSVFSSIIAAVQNKF